MLLGDLGVRVVCWVVPQPLILAIRLLIGATRRAPGQYALLMAKLITGIVQDQLDRYLGAWRIYDGIFIGDLFAEGAIYQYHPDDEPLVGREEIVASWQGDTDASDSWEAD